MSENIKERNEKMGEHTYEIKLTGRKSATQTKKVLQDIDKAQTLWYYLEKAPKNRLHTRVTHIEVYCRIRDDGREYTNSLIYTEDGVFRLGKEGIIWKLDKWLNESGSAGVVVDFVRRRNKETKHDYMAVFNAAEQK